MAFVGMKQAPIGLDIGKSSIMGVQLGGRPPAVSLLGVYERLIPEGLVFEGEVVDPDGLAAELKAFHKESAFKGKLVRLGVGNQKVIVRTIDVPEMDEQELRGAIEFQAQDYIPMPIEEVVLDFQVVGRSTDEDGTVRQQVVLVAAQRDMIQQFLYAVRKAGLKVDGIDVGAFALLRALGPAASFLDQGGGTAEAVGYLNVTSSTSTLVVASNDIPKFTRIVSFAYDNFTNVLVEHQGIPWQDALTLTQRIGLEGPLEASAEDFTASTIGEVRTALGRVAEQFAEEMRRSLDFYHSQEYAAPLSRMVLAGRGPLLRNLDHYLSEFLNVPVEVGNPLLKVGDNKSKLTDEMLAGLAPRLSVAVGLSLDEVE